MKNTKLFALLFLLVQFFLSCENNIDSTIDCGCNSETLTTISDSLEAIGQISYKEQTSTNSYYTDKYWITTTIPGCANCVHHLIICNESILTDNIINSLDIQEPLNIKFSGGLKEICDKRFDIADISYSRITLTKIEKQ